MTPLSLQPVKPGCNKALSSQRTPERKTAQPEASPYQDSSNLGDEDGEVVCDDVFATMFLDGADEGQVRVQDLGRAQASPG